MTNTALTDDLLTRFCSRVLLPALIVLGAFAVRTWSLESAPPGVTHDEAAHLHDARRISEGYYPIYLPTAYGREPLYDYFSAPLVNWLGMNVWTGRLISAFWGTVLVALVFRWCRQALDWTTAVIAEALIAFSFWPLSTSRQILRSITLPVVVTAALTILWFALYFAKRKRQLGTLALSGFFLGLSFYTYTSARVTWLIPVLFIAWSALVERKRLVKQLGIMILVALLVAAPLLLFVATHPELEVRLDELSAPLRALREGNLRPVSKRIGETALLFSHKGDVQWIYNISGRPLLPPLLSVMFYLGIGMAIWQALGSKGQAFRLLLLWLFIGIAPALVTGLESSSLRAIGSQPAVFIIATLPLSFLVRRVWPSLRRQWRIGLTAAIGIFLLWHAYHSGWNYFNVWAVHRDTRVAYHAHLKDIARYLEEQPESTPVTLSTLYPGRLHDPYAMEVILGRDDLSLFWHDGRFSLIFPDADAAQTIIPTVAPLDPSLQALVGPDAKVAQRVGLETHDLSPWFDVLAWEPRKARQFLPLSDPVDVGHTLAFMGYQLRPAIIEQGGEFELITFWEVLSQPDFDNELVAFSHLLEDSVIVSQQDRLDAPSHGWKPGVLIAQLHRMTLADDIEVGWHQLEVGIYQRKEGFPRLPTYLGDLVSGDKIELMPVWVDEKQ